MLIYQLFIHQYFSNLDKIYHINIISPSQFKRIYPLNLKLFTLIISFNL